MSLAAPVASTLIDGDGSYNAFPGYAVGASGALLAFYRKGAEHLSFDGRLFRATSRDGGASWEPGLLVEPCGETRGEANDDIRDAGAATLTDGRVLVIFNQRASGQKTPANTSWVIHSDDGGLTWSPPRQMETGFSGADGAFEAAPVELADGRLIVPGHGADRPGDRLYIRLLESHDRGETWSDLGVALKSATGNDWNEPWACQLADRRVLMLIRDESDYVAKATWSLDGGRTWTAPVPAVAACNSRPACVALPNGELLVLYRHHGRPWPTCARSSDGGASWKEPGSWPQPGAQGSFTYAQWQLLDAADGPAATAVMGQERDAAGRACDLWFIRFGIGLG